VGTLGEWECCNTFNLTGTGPYAQCLLPENNERWTAPVSGSFVQLTSLGGSSTAWTTATAKTTQSSSSGTTTSNTGGVSTSTGSSSIGSSSSGKVLTSTETSQPPATNSASNSSGGLTSGAKAGIGVGVALGVMLLAIIALLLILVRRRRSSPVHEMPPETMHEKRARQLPAFLRNIWGSPNSGVSELDGHNIKTMPPVEMPANERLAVGELSAGKDTPGPVRRAELEAPYKR